MSLCGDRHGNDRLRMPGTMHTPRRVQMLVTHFDGFRMPPLPDEQRAEMAHRGEGFEVVWTEHAFLQLPELPQHHLRITRLVLRLAHGSQHGDGDKGVRVLWSEHALLLVQSLPQQHLGLRVPSLLLEHHRELPHGAQRVRVLATEHVLALFQRTV